MPSQSKINNTRADGETSMCDNPTVSGRKEGERELEDVAAEDWAGNSPQLPLQDLLRTSAKIRSWTDDVVIKGSASSQHVAPMTNGVTSLANSPRHSSFLQNQPTNLGLFRTSGDGSSVDENDFSPPPRTRQQREGFGSDEDRTAEPVGAETPDDVDSEGCCTPRELSFTGRHGHVVVISSATMNASQQSTTAPPSSRTVPFEKRSTPSSSLVGAKPSVGNGNGSNKKHFDHNNHNTRISEDAREFCRYGDEEMLPVAGLVKSATSSWDVTPVTSRIQQPHALSSISISSPNAPTNRSINQDCGTSDGGNFVSLAQHHRTISSSSAHTINGGRRSSHFQSLNNSPHRSHLGVPGASGGSVLASASQIQQQQQAAAVVPSGPSVRDILKQHDRSQQLAPSPPPPPPSLNFSGRRADAEDIIVSRSTFKASAATDEKKEESDGRYTTIISIPREKRGEHRSKHTHGANAPTMLPSSTAAVKPTLTPSIARLYKPAPVSTMTVATSDGKRGDFDASYRSDVDDGDSVGTNEVVSLAADLGQQPPRLTQKHLSRLSAAGGDGSEDGLGALQSRHRRGGDTAVYGSGSNNKVPGIELCFDNLSIEAKQGWLFGSRKDLGGSRADYGSVYTFSAASAFGPTKSSDFAIANPDGPQGGGGGGGAGGASRWAFLWSSFQKGVTVHNVTGLFSSRGLHVIFCPDRFVGNTMLRSLAGVHRRSHSVVSGVALGNGLPVVTSVFRERRIFVSTAEMCIKDATVMENLTFAVNMRINTNYSDLLIYKAAEWTCLSSYLDVKVQDLRPCQVYMLAVAMELVLDPSILFLSYPLDDLNISDQGEVIAMLRKLSRRKSVVISLDTMPFALSEGISQLLLLSRDGRMIFSGSPAGLQSFLSKLKREDTAVNDAVSSKSGDSATELNNGNHADTNRHYANKRNKRSGNAAAANNVQYGFYGGICNAVDLIRLWEAENLIPQVVAAFTQTSEFKALKSAVAAHKQKATRSGADGGFQRVPRTVPPPPSWLKRNILLLHYVIQTTFRMDFLFSWLFLIVSFVVCIFLGDSQSSDQGGMQNLRGIIFFLLNCVVHVNVMFIESMSLERESFGHLLNNRYFNVAEYFLATMFRIGVPRLAFSFITALFAKMIFVAVYPLAILAGLTSFAHSLLVLLTVYLWPRPQDVVFVQQLYYAYSVVFCGFLINITSIPRFFSAISLLRPGYGGAISHMLKNKPYSCENFLDKGRNVTVAGYCYTGDQYLALQGFNHDSLGINAAELSIIAGVLMALILICMVLL